MGDPSVIDAHIDEVRDEQVPIRLSPRVELDVIDEMDVIEFLREPRREGDGVINESVSWFSGSL